MTKFSTILFLGALFASQVFSATTSPDTLATKEINEVTVVGNISGKLALPLAVVNKQQLQAASFFTPADALQRCAGVTLTRDGVWGTSVNVRGLSEQRLLLLVDGDRIQTSSDIAAALSTVDMTALEKIEVVKGAGSVLYGSGAMGGIVNFVSERPTYSATFKNNGKISTGFNSVNNLWENSANLNFSTNQWYLALTGSFRTAQNAQSPKAEITSSQFHDASWGLKSGIKYSKNEEFLVNYQYVKGWDIGIPGGSAFPATASVRYKGVNRTQLSGEYIISDINEMLKTLTLKVYTQNMSRDVENKVNSVLTYLPSSLNKTYGAKLSSDWHLSNNQSLKLGAEGWQRESETIRLKKDYAVNNDVKSLLSITGQQPVANAKMLDLGTFAHYSYNLIPNKLLINAGLRLDYIRTANDSAFNPVYKLIPDPSSSYYLSESTGKNEGSDFILDKKVVRTTLFLPHVENELSYGAHIDMSYYLTKNQLVLLSLANSYRTASIDERFKYIDLGTVIKVGNPYLKPERGTFLNLSYALNTSKLHFKTDVYANYLLDLIAEKSGTYIGRIALINTNISKALFLGAEVEANWNMCKHFSWVANASYTRGRDVDNDSPLPQIPPLSGFASLNYHSGKVFEASFSTLWAGRQSQVATGETATDGHIIFNVDAHTTPIQCNSAYLQFFAGVDNLLNTAYYNHLTSARSGGTHLYYEPGRNIYLKAKLNF